MLRRSVVFLAASVALTSCTDEATGRPQTTLAPDPGATGITGGGTQDDGAPTGGDASTGGVSSADDGTTASADSSGEDDSSAGEDDSSTGPASWCGNGAIDQGEVCDGDALGDATCVSQGYDAGSLGCAEDCTALRTNACETTCGNGVAGLGETCDGQDLGPETCVTQGYDSGELACAASCDGFIDTGCGTCGNAVVDGTEACDGANLGGATCTTQGFAAGALACDDACGFVVSGCWATSSVTEIPATQTTAGATAYFRSNAYTATSDGAVLEFGQYLALGSACTVDFYAWRAASSAGPFTLLERTSVLAPAGTGYVDAGFTEIPISTGDAYVFGIGWNCAATYYFNTNGTYSGASIGLATVGGNRWDNAYPGASDAYFPPNIGGTNTVYAQRFTVAQ